MPTRTPLRLLPTDDETAAAIAALCIRLKTGWVTGARIAYGWLNATPKPVRDAQPLGDMRRLTHV